MKSKAKPNRETDPHARPLPVEEFALLAEGLSEADIEAVCAKDGADVGGVPPAWSTPRPMNKLGERPDPPSFQLAPAQLWFEWEPGRACRIVARDEGLAVFGIHDGDEFDIDVDVKLDEGNLVAVEGIGGRLLRKLRHVGGVRLLCSGNPELPAIAFDDHFRCLGVASLADCV